MKSHMFRKAIVCCVFLGVLLVQCKRSSGLPTMVTFGDSLMDDGEYFKLSKRDPSSPFAIPDKEYYFKGRFSDGPVWPEQLAATLGVKLRNYAVGGSSACTAYKRSVDFPLADSLQQIVGRAVAQIPPLNWSASAAILASGSNDLFVALADPAAANNIATCILNSAEALLLNGCQKLAILAVPPIQYVPAVRLQGEAVSGLVELVVNAINVLINNGVTSLNTRYPGRVIQLVSVNAPLEQLLTDAAFAASLGFTDTKYPCYTCPTLGKSAYLCSGVDIQACSDAERAGKVFVDDLHPTARVHALLAQLVGGAVTATGGIYSGP